MFSVLTVVLLVPGVQAGRSLEARANHCYILGAAKDDGEPFYRAAKRREVRGCVRACEDGSGLACSGLAGILRLQGSEAEALSMYRHACDRLEWSACRALGDEAGMLAGLDHECALGEEESCQRAADARERAAAAAERQARQDALTCDTYSAYTPEGGAVKFTRMVCVNEAGGLPDWADVGRWRETVDVEGCGVGEGLPVRLSGVGVEVLSQDEALVDCVSAALMGAPFSPVASCTFRLTTGGVMPVGLVDLEDPERPAPPEGVSDWPTACPPDAP